MPYIQTPEFQQATINADLARRNERLAANRLRTGMTPTEFNAVRRAIADGIVTPQEKRVIGPILARLKRDAEDPYRVNNLVRNFVRSAAVSNRAAAARDLMKLEGNAEQWVPNGRVFNELPAYDLIDRPVFVDRPIYRERNYGPGAHTWDGRSIASNGDTPGESLKHRLREAGNDAIVEAFRRQLGVG